MFQERTSTHLASSEHIPFMLSFQIYELLNLFAHDQLIPESEYMKRPCPCQSFLKLCPYLPVFLRINIKPQDNIFCLLGF